MAYEYFTAKTKLGRVSIYFITANEIKVDTHPESGRDSLQNSPLVNRGVPYRASQHFVFNEAKGKFEAVTYGRDGNTRHFVSDPEIDSPYYRYRAMYAARLDRNVNDTPSDSAKAALFEALNEGAQNWFNERKEFILKQMAEKEQAQKVARVKALQIKMGEKAAEVRALELELMEAAKEAGISPFHQFE